MPNISRYALLKMPELAKPASVRSGHAGAAQDQPRGGAHRNPQFVASYGRRWFA